MEMFLMGLCATVLVLALAIASAKLGAATRSDSSDATFDPELPGSDGTNSFSQRAETSPAVQPQSIPTELLLLQIEDHVRAEQAAAESFLAFPTQAQLYRKTTSPFVS